ncbi:hypothetical protein K505DRAFT_96762 [Melanomma pulvis-pyrius CBS 109.77]|uniref:Uncharacterized protein n=1 Tax=Melanomma pulvis-pyrius CBS 109.77 TaxID=1314802 RepID=A0A6A6WZ96_9PLEO|nr:hypothetical protein K505DRAFT_96762 [Melanomma pulvis-pyrius CBS 109.77]
MVAVARAPGARVEVEVWEKCALTGLGLVRRKRRGRHGDFRFRRLCFFSSFLTHGSDRCSSFCSMSCYSGSLAVARDIALHLRAC